LRRFAEKWELHPREELSVAQDHQSTIMRHGNWKETWGNNLMIDLNAVLMCGLVRAFLIAAMIYMVVSLALALVALPFRVLMRFLHLAGSNKNTFLRFMRAE
jgi:hypothetical protein